MSARLITIISPDRHQASRMCACLRDAGYRTAATVLAENTLDDLCRQSPELLLLEWRLFDSGILAFVRRIRQDGCLARLPVILMGSELREEDALHALEAGADQCWREPFNPRVLVARVHAYFRPGIERKRSPDGFGTPTELTEKNPILKTRCSLCLCGELKE